jgi:AraC-like DNA-binding protein
MRFHYSTDDLSPDEREPYWREVWSKLVFRVTHDDRPDPSTFRADVDVMLAGRFAVLDVDTGHRTHQRTEREVAGDRKEMLYLLRPRCAFHTRIGPTSASAHDLKFASGDLGIASSEWHFNAAANCAISFDMLLIPAAVLAPLLGGGQLTRPLVMPSGSPMGSLLGTAFDAAKTNLPSLSPEFGDAVLHNLCGLVALACGASEEGQSHGRKSVRAAHLEKAKRHIEQHLAESDLGPTTTADALGISLGYLHRLFEPTGTSFTQYVQRSRLMKCRDTLGSVSGAGRSVADIAFGWGFNSLATFYRAFAREFGSSPRSVGLSDDTTRRMVAPDQ